MGKTASMVMDVQNGIIERFSVSGDLAPLQSAVHTARDKGIAVIFVRVLMEKVFPRQAEVTVVALWQESLT